MGVTEQWQRILRWLDDYAPVTAAALRPGGDPAAVRELERQTGLSVPAELREWWRVCGGTEDRMYAEILPPFYTPYGPAGSLRCWQVLHGRPGEVIAGAFAGSPARGFHPAWLPIAFDGCGDALAVDLRPGPLRGCVLEWDRARSEVTGPEWPGILEMLDQVADALETLGRLAHCEPLITTAGRLDWRTR